MLLKVELSGGYSNTGATVRRTLIAIRLPGGEWIAPKNPALVALVVPGSGRCRSRTGDVVASTDDAATVMINVPAGTLIKYETSDYCCGRGATTQHVDLIYDASGKPGAVSLGNLAAERAVFARGRMGASLAWRMAEMESAATAAGV